MRRLEALGWGWRHRTCTAEGTSTRDRVGSAARPGLDTKVLGMGVDQGTSPCHSWHGEGMGGQQESR